MSDANPAIKIVGLDADDTLWQNEYFFRMTEDRLAELLADHAEGGHVKARLLEAEKRNLGIYGFGIKGFTLSMVETALDVTDGQVPGSVIRQIVDTGRELLQHPVDTLPGVAETLDKLAIGYRLVLVTKGDLIDQERKLAQSGLGELFTGVEIVSNKVPATYERVFNQYGDGPESALMAGNSLRSDVIPALEAGAWGIYVPHDLTWAHEHAETPSTHERFREAERFDQLPEIIASLGRG